MSRKKKKKITKAQELSGSFLTYYTSIYDSIKDINNIISLNKNLSLYQSFGTKLANTVKCINEGVTERDYNKALFNCNEVLFTYDAALRLMSKTDPTIDNYIGWINQSVDFIKGLIRDARKYGCIIGINKEDLHHASVNVAINTSQG